MSTESYPTTPFLIDLAVSSERAIHARHYPKESPMQHQPITSSMFTSVAYDPDTQTLEVEFTSGHRYRAEGVLPEHHAEFMAADSQGQHYNRRLKSQYQFMRVETPDASTDSER